jgi:hypothetical protein
MAKLSSAQEDFLRRLRLHGPKGLVTAFDATVRALSRKGYIKICWEEFEPCRAGWVARLRM